MGKPQARRSGRERLFYRKTKSRVEAPAARSCAGIKVRGVDELVDNIKNEAKVDLRMTILLLA